METTKQIVDFGAAGTIRQAAKYFAPKVGEAPSLVAGSSRSLLSPTALEELFLFQRTANGAGGTGAAVFQSIKGNSVVVNQIVPQFTNPVTVASVVFTPGANGVIDAHGTATDGDAVFYLTDQFTLLNGRSYIARGCPAGGSASTYSFRDTVAGRVSDTGSGQFITRDSDGACRLAIVVKSGTTVSHLKFRPEFFDITKFVLSGITSVADFNKFYPAYIAPNPGAIKNNCATGMVTKDADDNILDTVALPICTATGKLNGEGASVVITPDGMAGVGTSFDEAIVEKGMWTKTEKVFSDEINLGGLSWTYNSTKGFFYAVAPVNTKVWGNTATGNAVCSRYSATTPYRAYEQAGNYDKSFSISSYWTSDNVYIVVIDSAYTDADTFKTAMAGVKLVAELTTPQLYVLDTPVPVVARVDEDGTQTILPQGVDESGAPMTAPFKASIQYPVKLGVAPIGQQSLVNLLERMKSAGKIASYTMFWDAATGAYDFTIS